MRKRSLIAGLGLGVLLLVSPGVDAQEQPWHQDVTDCFFGSVYPSGAAAAIPACTRSIDRATETSSKAASYYWRGLAHEHLGNTSAAVGDFKRAYELGNRDDGLLKKLRQYGALR